jgi:nucleotide-binding universal stress UspA family protein
VATEIIHRAPCSVLVARKMSRPLPRTIVVGLDGSAESATAYRAASELAERTGAELWPVVAHGGKPVDRVAISALAARREELPDEPVKALVAAAADADLLVVGSRGLHGIKALGSVSERVAHQAQCSTLIVREPYPPSVDPRVRA